jgi:hypothetical protein
MFDGNDDTKCSYRRIELLTGPGRRRRWSDEDKARIVSESLAPGACVSAVARRWHVLPQQVFGCAEACVVMPSPVRRGARQRRRRLSFRSAEHIMVGMQCGGSDGFSGLSANPALGAAMDILVRHGGTAILSETTEIFDVEHTLNARAVTPEVVRS